MIRIVYLLIIYLLLFNTCKSEFCENTDCDQQEQFKYLFYDVNPPEGFNLRRDVYMRFAVFVHKLKHDERFKNWKLVLPPWSHLYHWKHELKPENLPWSHFFDLKSLQKFAPVIEMHQFFDEIGVKYSKIKLDQVYVLQHFQDMFTTGKFEDKMSAEKCTEEIRTNFFYYSNITAKKMECLSFHGHASQLKSVLLNSNARTILIDHAEVALHDSFGDALYWRARRSMRFNKTLIKAALNFQKQLLNSTNEEDMSTLPEDWQDEIPRRNAKGGPFLSVHLRQRDFTRGHKKDTPDIKSAATQINKLLDKLNLNVVFVATDAPKEECDELQALLTPKLMIQFHETDYTEGQMAIIDQIICSHAYYFVGTHESTFTFRIQEEREILGFPVERTFNRLCGDECEKPSTWTIVY